MVDLPPEEMGAQMARLTICCYLMLRCRRRALSGSTRALWRPRPSSCWWASCWGWPSTTVSCWTSRCPSPCTRSWWASSSACETSAIWSPPSANLSASCSTTVVGSRELDRVLACTLTFVLSCHVYQGFLGHFSENILGLGASAQILIYYYLCDVVVKHSATFNGSSS